MRIRKMSMLPTVLVTLLLVTKFSAPVFAQQWIETTAIGDFADKSHAGRQPVLEGDTLVFGLMTYSGDFHEQGKVEVYRRNDRGTVENRLDDIWVMEAEIFPGDPADGDRFGQSLCIRGSTLFIGSQRDDEAGVDAGAVYWFERVDDTWIEVDKFVGSDTTDGDWFGNEMHIENDVLVVGAMLDDNDLGVDAGAAYVYRFDGVSWNEEAKLTRFGGRAKDLFSRDVHVQGNEIFVSTAQRAKLGDDLGTLHVFGFDVEFGWIEKQSFTGSDSVDKDAFAYEFEVHGDRLAAASVAANEKQGSVYVFARDDNDTPGYLLDDLWVEQAKIVASDGEADDRFGRGVEIGESQVIVGTWNSSVNVPESGSVYIYDLDDNGTPANLLDDAWIETDEIEASNAVEGNRFGTMLHLEGNTLIVGDPEFIDDGVVGTGQVYVLELVEPPVAEPRMVVVDTSADDAFEYDLNGSLLDDYPLGSGNNSPKGVTSDSLRFRWVIDNDDYVYAYDPTGAKIGVWKATGLSRPEGIATDGAHLWIVDRGTDRVYFFENGAARTSGSAGATSSFKLRSGNTNPRGIHTDGSTMWVVNIGRKDRIYLYNMTGTSLGYWQLDSANYNPRGVTIDDEGNLLTVDVSRDAVYFYDGAATRTSGSQSASDSSPLAPANYNPQGITISP